MATKKSPVRKSARKTVVAKPARKATVVKAVKKAPASIKRVTTAVKDPFTKTQVMAHIAEETELTKKQVAEVFVSLENLIDRHIKKRGAGTFALPGLAKIVTVRKPATKARKGINPFTGEETMFKAKPARTVVKVRPLKRLKEMAN